MEHVSDFATQRCEGCSGTPLFDGAGFFTMYLAFSLKFLCSDSTTNLYTQTAHESSMEQTQAETLYKTSELWFEPSSMQELTLVRFFGHTCTIGCVQFSVFLIFHLKQLSFCVDTTIFLITLFVCKK
jgi:hypothetical protein